ncbi:EAL domain-containing protein [Photobacterium piscicola]|uniref:EAL domain-containing protein n=1 Tax=Photobacterium piscicola TaxID=1378299 RepID=UPI002E18BF1D|nr:EAL domain-containing protein [Photobacterium piscicola]
MYKIKSWFKSRLIADYAGTMMVVAIFIIIFMAISFTLLSPYIAREQLSSKLDTMSSELVDNYSTNIGEYHELITDVVNNINFDCSKSDRKYIKTKTYNKYYIKNLQDNISLWAIDNNKEQSILSLVWEDTKGKVSIDFEPIISKVTRNKHCDDCILTVVSIPNNNKTLHSQDDDENVLSKQALNIEVFKNSLILKNYVDPQLLSLISMDLKPLLFIIGGLIGLLVFFVINTYTKHQLSLHSLIIKGIWRKEFIPYYQPIINVKNNKMYGCEVLVRWWFNKKELISPDEFIPYAESNGLIIHITDILLEKTLAQLSSLDWNKSSGIISINLVPEQLENKLHMRKAVDLIIKSSISPKLIAFEITERMSFTDLDKAAAVIDYLKAQGINVKLDDAGTGYGSFSYIQHLKLQSLKIDKMFVDTIGTFDHRLSVLDSIIAFGKKSGMEMIAEGVETKEQSEYLLNNGVYLQQGYYFSEPLKFEQFHDYYKQDQVNN